MMTAFLTVLLGLIFLVQVDAGCGGNLTNLVAQASALMLTSPNYPAAYMDGEVCIWTITTSLTGHTIQLEILDMDLDNWDGNCSDSVRVYNGTDASAPELQKYCGSEKIPVRSSGPSLHIVFNADNELNNKGFSIRYWSRVDFDASCKANDIRTIMVDNNLPLFVNLPDYQGHFSGNQYCRYQFEAQDGSSLIKVKFVEWTDVEVFRGNNGYIKFIDGNNISGPSMVKWNQKDKPFSGLLSSSQHLLVEAYTIHQVTIASPTSRPQIIMKVKAYPSNSICKSSPLPAIRTDEDPKYMWFPSQKNMSCSVRLWGKTASYTVRVEVLKSLTTEKLNCATEYLDVYDGYTGSGLRAQKTCRMSKPVYMSSGQNIVINQKLNSTKEKYLLRVLSLEKPCNGGEMKYDVRDDKVQMVSVSEYDNNAVCKYVLSAQTGEDVVNLRLTGKNLDCKEDYITAYDGQETTDTELGKFCGQSDLSVTSTGQFLTYVLTANEHSNAGSFNAHFYSYRKAGKCEKMVEIEATDEPFNITSPNYPNNYPIDSDCTWVFTAFRPHLVIQVELLESSLPFDCSDVVYVRDGESMDDDLLQRWCGNDQSTIKSTGTSLSIQFKADQMVTKSTFVIRVSAVTQYARDKEGTPVEIIAGVGCIILLLAGLIFVAVRLCQRRAEAKKAEDKQVLTD